MQTSASRHAAVEGFSLVEVMVGLVIGMLALLAILRILTLTEAQRRTTSGSSDAENNGALALHILQRDIRQAGYGFSVTRLLGCSLSLRTGVSLSALAPLTINSANVAAGDAQTDTLLIVYGSAGGSPEGTGVIQQTAQAQYTVTTPTAFATGDRIIPAIQTRPTPCSLTLEQVSAVTSSPPVVSVASGTAAMSNGALFNLGPSPIVIAYAVRSGELTACDYLLNNCSDSSKTGDRSVWVAVASGVVSLRAQYARDTSTPADAIVDAYDQSLPASACAWTRALATRVAVVARSAQLEKTNVSSSAPTWAGSATAAINLSANSDWQRHRYQVFQTTVPTRNLAWMGVPAGC